MPMKIRGPSHLAAVVLTGATAAFAQSGASRILLCGDSMLKAVARSIVREFSDTPSMTCDQQISIGTGLARPDVHNWPAKIREAATSKPAVAVIFLGANDNQNLQAAGGQVAVFGTPEWDREYASRVAAVLRELREAGVRHILWLGLPDMREKKLHDDTRRINAILRAECDRVPEAEYFDVAPLFSPQPGTYSAYVVRGGKVVQTRANDGIHLNVEGADILARAIRERLSAKPGLLTATAP